MVTDYQMNDPVLFNPLKHHLGFIREFIDLRTEIKSVSESKELTRELKHLGISVMDIYTGSLSVKNICSEVAEFLEKKVLLKRYPFSLWVGKNVNDFRIITLSDGSQWTLKYHDSEERFVHIFPARLSPRTFRIKSNTLKSAILYVILVGKNYITEEDLNAARALVGLSPIREVADTEAITEMIEIIRDSGSSDTGMIYPEYS
jgi:hypothetical protein